MSEDGEASQKPSLPEDLRELGERAIGRHLRRSATPELDISLEDGAWWVESPFSKDDEDHWVALLFDAFGTRSQGTCKTFINQLCNLCSTEWSDKGQAWHPNKDQLVAAIQIVRSTKPRTEAEACLAAEMVAVHVMQMKLSAHAVRNDWPDPRSCAIAGKLARTYAAQLEAIAKLKGRGSRQRITVRKYSQHEHKHIHLHRGEDENGNQPHEPRASGPTEIRAALEHDSRPALSCADATRDTVPASSFKNEKPMSTPRRS